MWELQVWGTGSRSPHSSYGAGGVMVPTFQMEEWRLTEVKSLAHGSDSQQAHMVDPSRDL